MTPKGARGVIEVSIDWELHVFGGVWRTADRAINLGVGSHLQDGSMWQNLVWLGPCLVKRSAIV